MLYRSLHRKMPGVLPAGKPGDKWILLNQFPLERLHEFEDTTPYEWMGTHPYDPAEHFDRVLPDTLKKQPIQKSLIFRKINYHSDEAEIIYFNEKKGFKPSLRFKCGGIRYKLKITDIKIPQDPTARPATEKMKSAYVTIGLGHSFDAANGAHFKLVVGIIRIPEGQ